MGPLLIIVIAIAGLVVVDQVQKFFLLLLFTRRFEAAPLGGHGSTGFTARSGIIISAAGRISGRDAHSGAKTAAARLWKKTSVGIGLRNPW